jgi:hypothetical protein
LILLRFRLSSIGSSRFVEVVSGAKLVRLPDTLDKWAIASSLELSQLEAVSIVA